MHIRNGFPDMRPKCDKRSQKKEQNAPNETDKPPQEPDRQTAGCIVVNHPADDNAKNDKIAQSTGAFHQKIVEKYDTEQ